MFQGVVHSKVKTGFCSYVLKTDTLMQSTRLIFEKKSKFDTAFEGKAVENLYFCSQINRNLAEYIMKHFVIKYWWVFLCLVAVSLYSCDNNNLTGKSYQGYYNACERIYIEFESNSQVEGEISSTDFVGRFTDYVRGHYEYKHPYIIITWTKADSDNEVYKNVISNPDSTIVNESLDTLRLYEGNEEYILPRYHLYQIDENASFMEKVGQYSYQTFLLIIIFIVRYFFYIIAAIVILRFAIRWRKKRKK